MSITLVTTVAAAGPTHGEAPGMSVLSPGDDAPAWSALFGAALDVRALDALRGGSEVVAMPATTSAVSNGTVRDNRAIDVITGSNSIAEGSFSNASGLPIVIQNTGANVLIQNATVVNVQLR